MKNIFKIFFGFFSLSIIILFFPSGSSQACVSVPKLELKNCEQSIFFDNYQNEENILTNLKKVGEDCNVVFNTQDIEIIKNFVVNGYSVKQQTENEYLVFLGEVKKINQERPSDCPLYEAVSHKGNWTGYIETGYSYTDNGICLATLQCGNTNANIVYNDLKKDYVAITDSTIAINSTPNTPPIRKEIINLSVGEEKKIAENISIKLVKLLEINEGKDCSRQDLKPCYTFLELRMGEDIKNINLYKYSSYQISSDISISLQRKESERVGLFEIQKGLNSQTQTIELEQETSSSPEKPILENDISKPLSYHIIETKEREKEEFISISSEEIIMYDEEKETETIYKSPIEGVKPIIKVRISERELLEEGEEKISRNKELYIKPIREKVILEVIREATDEDCEQYLSECKKGDEIICQKYEFNCQNLEKQTCENYLLSCQKGSKEACQKWDLNCKKEEITVETCGKILSLCQSGVLESCKEYNNSCQQKEIVTASTKEELKIQNEKIYVNEKEVKVMPDVASEKAIEILSLKKEVEIELKDVGKPVYEILGKEDVKILGLIKAKMNIRANIDAETGEIEDIKKPWWSFLTF